MAGALRSLQLRILAQAQTSPGAEAVPLVLARQACGSVNPVIASFLAKGVPGFRYHDGLIELDDTGLDAGKRSKRLEQAARLLVEAEYVRSWRDEELEVRPEPDAPALACIDRCAVRVLGITTYSVHLNGYTHDRRLVIARRAARKRVDPGLWDNLAGGMIAAREDVYTALSREAFEEAGLRLDPMTVVAGARIAVRRPIGEGILSEMVHVFDIDLPDGAVIRNQDGEVDCFAERPIEEVVVAIERGEFTVEAALATLDSLLRRGFS